MAPVNNQDRFDPPDEKIIRYILEGNIEYFRLLVERYQRRIFSLGRQFFRNSEDAADFVQEVFIRVYEKLGTFRGESRFYSWLIRVAYNFGINSMRRARSYMSLAEETMVDPSLTPEQSELVEEARTALRKGLHEIPKKYAVCLDLYFFYGLSYDEISSTTGYPINTIKSHVFRGKKMLRDTLKGTAAEDFHAM